MKAWPILVITLASLLLQGCGEDDQPSTRVGADRDSHGCIPSAGYQWCEQTGMCEQPWALAKREGFENSSAAFADFCGNEGDR